MDSQSGARRLEIINKLPPYEQMRRMVLLQGYSYRDLGRKYGVSPGNVYTTFKRRAIAHGDPWPLQTQEVREAKKRRANARKISRQYVDPTLIRLDLIQYRQRTGVTMRWIADACGVSPSCISSLLNQRHRWLKRPQAYKISAFLARRDRNTDLEEAS